MTHHNSYSHSLHLLLFIYSLFQITISTSPSNQYETDNDTYWKSISSFRPSLGATYERLKRRKSMYFALKFQFYGKTVDTWENIIRIGDYGSATSYDCDEHGNRYPALFILPSNNGLQISLSDESDCWFVIESNYHLIQNIIYSLIIQYNETHSSVEISTYNATTNQIIKPLHLISNTSRTNDNTLLGKYMDIIISDPLATPANVLLWDIIIISYDNILTFPTESPTKSPTISPTITTTTTTTYRPTNRIKDDFDVHVTIFVDYNAVNNNTNKTENDKVIRDITEDIINNYIHNISNGSNNTIIHVIISDIENKQYDIVLISNYTTNNQEIAILLEALFENELETELLNKIKNSNNSITINDINVEVTITNPNNKSENIYNNTETTKISIVLPKNDISLIWIIVIISCFIMVCIFIIGFCIGIKYTKYKPNLIKLRTRTESNVLNEYENDIGNIQNDEKLKQHSDNENENENENEYSEPAQLGLVMESTNEQEDIINNIRNDIFEVAMGTPVGGGGVKKTKINRNNSTSELQIVDNINNIKLHQLDDMDEDDDLDIEDMYDYQNTKGNIQVNKNNYTNISPQITDEGNNIHNITQ